MNFHYQYHGNMGLSNKKRALQLSWGRENHGTPNELVGHEFGVRHFPISGQDPEMDIL